MSNAPNLYTPLKAGRDLDKVVAGRCMKWSDDDLLRGGRWGDNGTEDVPRYSTDIRDAWELFTHFGFDQYWRLEPVYKGPFGIKTYWVVSVEGDTGSDLVSIAETAPLAICRAALSVWANCTS